MVMIKRKSMKASEGSELAEEVIEVAHVARSV